MLKSFIVAATSIICILSLSNITNAEVKKSDRTSITRFDLTADRNKASKSSAIAEKELKAIYNSVNEYYRQKNTNALNSGIDDCKTKNRNDNSMSGNETSTSVTFYDVKKLTLIKYSLHDDSGNSQSAKVEVIFEENTYIMTANHSNPKDLKLTFRLATDPRREGRVKKYTYKYEIPMIKHYGPWAVNQHTMAVEIK